MSKTRERLSEYRDEAEGLRLEFKRSHSLDDPVSIARAVCSLLNAKGGEVVIGITDAGELDPIPDAEAARRSLSDRLVATVEPSLPAEVAVDVLIGNERGDGLVVRVPRQAEARRRLFAVKLPRGSFAVYRRSNDRTDVLNWMEILDEAKSSAGPDKRSPTLEEHLEGEIVDWRAACERESARLASSGGLYVVLHSDPAARFPSKREFESAASRVVDPTALGIRRTGYHYWSGGMPFTAVPGLHDALETGARRDGFRWLRLSRTGTVRFATRIIEDDRAAGVLRPYAGRRTALDPRFPIEDPRSGAARVLRPLPLLETLVSLCRLQRAFLADGGGAASDQRLGIAVLLTGVIGARIAKPRFGHPDVDDEFQIHERSYPHAETPVLEIAIERAQVEDTDRFARMIGTKIFDEFGAGDEEIPYFDDATGTFRFA